MVQDVNQVNQYFEYTYSAKQQKEVEQIRKKYLPKEEDKMEILRKMDKEAEKPGKITSLALGIMGSLLLGIGMCCTMIWNHSLSIFVVGIIVGIIGMPIMAVAYPVYIKVTKKQREKIANQVLELTEELCLY